MRRVRVLREDDRPWARTIMRERWGDEAVVAHGVTHDPAALPGFVAMGDAGERAGLVTYVIEGSACEIVTIDALIERSGHGREMVDAVATVASDAGCTRLWLVTTNDNRHALGFYRALGFEVTAVRPAAIDEARKLKPSIPWVSEDGVSITDEIELERRL